MGVPAPLTYPASGDCVLDYALRLHTRGRGRFALIGTRAAEAPRQGSPLWLEMALYAFSPPCPWGARGRDSSSCVVWRSFACVFAALLPVVSAHGDSTDPATVGQWGPVMSWPLVAVHAACSPRAGARLGRLRRRAELGARVRPADRAMRAKPYARNLFCSGFSQLADGRLFIAGGHVGQQRPQGLDDVEPEEQHRPAASPTSRTRAGTRLARRWPTGARSSSPATTSSPTTPRPATRSRTSPNGARDLQPDDQHLPAADERQGRHAAVPVHVRT